MARAASGDTARVAGLMMLVFLATLSGCWRASEISRARAERSIASGSPRILVVPLNVAISLGSGLEAAVEPVQGEILAHLGAQGARVAFLDREDAQALWDETIRTARNHQRNTASLQVVAGAFVRSLAGQVQFDLLVLPSLGYREARLERGYALWDGVQRSLTVRHRQTALQERVAVYSLHAQIYMPDGRPWFQRWAGVDLVSLSDLDSDPALTPEQVGASQDSIRDAVALALSYSQEATDGEQ